MNGKQGLNMKKLLILIFMVVLIFSEIVQAYAANTTNYLSDSAGNPDYTSTVTAFSESNKWQNQIVDVGPDVGFYTSLAVDSLSHPHILFGDSDGLKYARYNGVDWVIELIEAGGYYGIGSLLLDANDHPHLSYSSGNNQYSLMYVWHDGISWHTETLDSHNVGTSSLAMDANGHPHIAFYDDVEQKLKYARHDGTAWHIQLVDNSDVSGAEPSLALDKNDLPHISYRDPYGTLSDPNIKLKYASYDGSVWRIDVIENVGSSTTPSIKIDSLGQPHVSYTHGPGYPSQDYAVKHAWRDQGVWNTEVVVPRGFNESLLLDSNDKLSVTYSVEDTPFENFDLMYLWQDTFGNWHQEYLDGAFGRSSAQLAKNGCVQVSYTFRGINGTYSELRYAYRDAKPDLALSKVTTDHIKVLPGEVITYTLSLLNSSLTNSTTFSLTNSIPISTTYVSESAMSYSGTISDANGIEWWGVISPTTVITASFSVVIDGNLTGSVSIVNEATVVGNQIDPVFPRYAVYINPYEALLPLIVVKSR